MGSSITLNREFLNCSTTCTSEHRRRAWLTHGHRQSGSRTLGAKNPLLLQSAPHAFSSIICSRQSTNLTAADHLQMHSQTLWTIFKQRVYPFAKILFGWELNHLESVTTTTTRSIDLDDTQMALLSSIYLASVVSLSDVECQTKLQQSKVQLLSELQILCEEALAKMNILCMKNTVSVKAMVFYIVSAWLDKPWWIS